MRYFINLFSPETYKAFSESDRTISGFTTSQETRASSIEPGDKFICYMTKLSRWIGVFRVEEGPFRDDTPIFYEEDDPFVIRFRVDPIVWLPKDKTVPIHTDEVWNHLSFTRGLQKNSTAWTGMVRGSLRKMQDEDGLFLEQFLRRQAANGTEFLIDEAEFQKYVTHRVRRLDKVVSVSVPEDDEDEEGGGTSAPETEVRESTRIQALVASIGEKMGFHVWLPMSDRSRVFQEWDPEGGVLLDELPLNYDTTTLKTIEKIDVLWLQGRAIARAFEVEHTTAVYSGILRMADLLALQPNMDIKLHIVAPAERREKVFREIRRPVFSLLDRSPLSERCTLIAYDSLRELAGEKHLEFLRDDVIDDYAEEAE